MTQPTFEEIEKQIEHLLWLNGFHPESTEKTQANRIEASRLSDLAAELYGVHNCYERAEFLYEDRNCLMSDGSYFGRPGFQKAESLFPRDSETSASIKRRLLIASAAAGFEQASFLEALEILEDLEKLIQKLGSVGLRENRHVSALFRTFRNHHKAFTKLS